MDDLLTRPAGSEDVPDIIELLRAALGETPMLRRTPELWAWKHQLNPFGHSIVLLAVSGTRIAGVRALMRWELATPQGHVLRCVRPVDTATHPDFARRGIFRNLTLEALDVAKGDGVHLVFNTPNAQSGPGYLAMGWGEVGRVGVLGRIRVGRAVTPNPEEVPSLTDLAPGAQPFHPVTEPPPRQPIGLRTIRGEPYQSWRFGGHPTVRYGLAPDGIGAAVLRGGVRAGRAELVLSDLLGGAGRRAVRAAGRMNRARYMAGFFSQGSPERRSSLAGGMVPIPGAKGLRLVALPLVDLDFDVFNPASWDIATSDLELL